MYPEQSYNQENPPSSHPPPKVIDNRPHDTGTVHVTFALPQLRRAVVNVPYHRWQQGGHLPVGHALAGMLADLERQDAAISDSVPG